MLFMFYAELLLLILLVSVFFNGADKWPSPPSDYKFLDALEMKDLMFGILIPDRFGVSTFLSAERTLS